MELVEVADRLGEPALLEVLQLSVGQPTPERLADVAATYRFDSSWKAYALMDGGTVLGVAGVESTAPRAGRIRHIAVRPDAQRSGVGRRLIEALRGPARLEELYAETHAGAVPFYERCGFQVSSLGEVYPGVERFACRWRAG